MIRIEAVTEVTSELVTSIERLLPQLNPNLPVPDTARLQRLVGDPAVTLLVAREGGDIVGTSTVIVYSTPFWIKARLDEVVVDAAARGKGVGEALVNACLDIARKQGVQVVELQSGKGPEREVANRLYRRMGFRPRDTNVYRLKLE